MRYHSIACLLFILEITSCGKLQLTLAESPPNFSDIDANEVILVNRGVRGTQAVKDMPMPIKPANNNSTARLNIAADSSLNVVMSKTTDGPKVGVMIVKDRPPDANYTKKTSIPDESFDNSSEENDAGYPGGQPKFDEKAVQRALVVVAALAFVILGYLGVKFMLTKKNKVDKRYGRIESEIDLLDEMDTAESDEEEELFDVNVTRRSNF